MNDRTAEKEREIQKEQKPSFHHLLRLFLYVFRATKGISCIYLGLFVLLSFLRPLIAEIWGRYISVVENAGNRVTEAALMLVLYWGISFAADLLESYLAPEGGGDFEQLDMIQANRQQELFKVHLLKKVNSVSPEYLEAPVMKDRMRQVFDFAVLGVGAYFIADALKAELVPGDIVVRSGNEEITALQNVTGEQRKNGSKACGGHFEIEAVADEFPVIRMDKGIVLEASQDPYGAMYYTVYNEDFSELYYRSERFAYPENDGTYYVVIDTAWGDKNHYFSTEHGFTLVIENDN